MPTSLASEDAFHANHDLITKYRKSSRLLFAIKIKYQIDDIDSIAAEYLTDGTDDKKCDLIYVNSEEQYAIIAQSYESDKECNGEAPSNKASDLNTAVGWALSADIEKLPERIRPASIALRDAIRNDQITRLIFWYVHNCSESANVKKELTIVEKTAHSALKNHYPGKHVEVQSVEIGNNTLEEWYQALITPILVSEEIPIDIIDGYELKGNDWSSYITAIPARSLYFLFQEHGATLFSANIRDYLGSRNSDLNINHNMKMTAEEDPNHFWIYNNGITALVNDYREISEDGRKKIVISGISIVNGAQTTGSIGSLSHPPTVSAYVPTRFVKCSNEDVIRKIIQYNNSQNKIKASDFRSNDLIQKRLREEFSFIPDVEYQGGRRGSYLDIIRRPPNLIPSDAVAQALASFHGNPTDAYNKKADLWENDAKYSSIFTDQTTAKHIIFVYSLLRAIEGFKLKLRNYEASSRGLREIEKEELAFLRERGAIFLLHSAIAHSIETIIDRPVPNKFRLSFENLMSPARAIDIWEPIVEATIPFYRSLSPAAKSSIQNREKVRECIGQFQSVIESTKTANDRIYREFLSNIQIS